MQRIITSLLVGALVFGAAPMSASAGESAYEAAVHQKVLNTLHKQVSHFRVLFFEQEQNRGFAYASWSLYGKETDAAAVLQKDKSGAWQVSSINSLPHADKHPVSYSVSSAPGRTFLTGTASSPGIARITIYNNREILAQVPVLGNRYFAAVLPVERKDLRLIRVVGTDKAGHIKYDSADNAMMHL